MGITAVSGPLISYGITQTSTGQVTEYNEQRAPSLFDCGHGMSDPRPAYCYQPGANVTYPTRGFWDSVGSVDCVPGTLSSNCIAATQVPSSSVYVTALTSSSTNNTVITAGVSLTPPEGGATVTGLLGIDMGTATSSLVGLQGITFGSTAGSVSVWDPRNGCARTIQWTGSSNSSNENLSVAGRDIYGFKMTETIPSSVGSSGAAVLTFKGNKAFKYISAVTLTATGTIGSTNLIVGVNDVYGFPIKVDQSPYAQMFWGPSSAMILCQLSTQFVAALASSITAVATSADARGTWASSGGSNSSQAAPERMAMFVSPAVYNVPTSATAGSAGLFGNTQFSSV